MAETLIEWTNATWNPTRGCTITSPGCKNCYAMKQAHRFSGPGAAYEGLTRVHRTLGPIWTGKMKLAEDLLDLPLRWRKPRRIFVNSMSDLFHEGLSDEQILRVFDVMRRAQHHTFQVLTKRAKRMRDFCSRLRFDAGELDVRPGGLWLVGGPYPEGTRPRPELDRLRPNYSFSSVMSNLWLGVSVEDQRRADERIPELLETPAAVRFLSCEPLLGELDLRPFFERTKRAYRGDTTSGVLDDVPLVDWVIVGGESGQRARPCDVVWLELVVRDCRDAGVACFVKQLGAVPFDHRESDRTTDEPHPKGPAYDLSCRLHLTHRKGGDPQEWPEILRVRQFPEVRT